MSRFQFILFAFLVALSLTFLVLGRPTDLEVSSNLSTVLLFPIKVVTRYIEFLAVSKTRIDELERAFALLNLENAELRNRLSTDSSAVVPAGYRLVKAHIIGRDPTNFNGYIYIDRNRRDSIEPGLPVIVQNGLIGRIKLAGNVNSIVETIENRGIAVSAVDIRTGVHGIVKQDGGMIFDYIKITDPIQRGDTIFTSGMSENFPSGIPIAIVNGVRETGDLLFKNVTLRPCVSVNRLIYVYVVRPESKNAFGPDTGLYHPLAPLWKLKTVIPERPNP